ncbi:MAG: hypothetical protein ABSA77_07765 [Thermoguttaceae bacterium]
MIARIIQCIPFGVTRREDIGQHRCELSEGVWIEPITLQLGKEAIKIYQNLPPQAQLSPTHLIAVDCRDYAQAFLRRLRADGQTEEQIQKFVSRFPDLKIPYYESPLESFLSPHDITRQALMSLALLHGFTFTVGGSMSVEAITEGKKTKYRCSGYAHCDTMQSSYILAGAHSHLGSVKIRSAALKTIFNQLNPYYNPYQWCTNRIAIALNCFWGSIITPFQDMAFLGFSTVLESLLSTSQNEIAHTLAERAALLLGKDEQTRLEIYRQVKKLYGIRSKLTHGDIVPKKGIQNTESLYVTAKRATVPHSKLINLAVITIRLLRAAINNTELRTAIGDLDTEGLHEFYLRLTFRR